MAVLNITCRVCSRSVRMIVNESTRSEFLGCAGPDYSEQEWASITDYLSPEEVATLRNRICEDCQGEPIEWPDLPVWVKGAIDRGDDLLALAKQCRWTVRDGDDPIYMAFTPTGQLIGIFNKE